jgi:Tol biopolymer transport system component
VLAVAGTVAAVAWAGAAPTTERVSVKSNGDEVAAESVDAAISASGRYVAFSSAGALVGADDNGVRDVYVHDRETGRTRRVSVATNGDEVSEPSLDSTISANGRFVAFETTGAFVQADGNGAEDVYVHDRRTGETERVSVKSNGSDVSEDSGGPEISGNGRFVAFTSDGQLTGTDLNAFPDVYVHDLDTGRTRHVSRSTDGGGFNTSSGNPAISASGRFIAFGSEGPFVSKDTNEDFDVYVHDRRTLRTKLVSVRSNGATVEGPSFDPVISPDGRFAGFDSEDAFVLADDNGFSDVYVHDRRTGKTRRVSVRSNGGEGVNHSYYSANQAFSADNRLVVFEAWGPLAGADDNGKDDIYVHNLQTGKTRRVSLDSNGDEVDAFSNSGGISANGRHFSFHSDGVFVPGDANGMHDVFVRGPAL